jgi:hypothetical protein
MGTAKIARGDLTGLDTLATDALVLPMFSEKKQPQGVAGFVDWRLCGRLGRMLLKKQFNGALGETVLMTPVGRFGAQRIFLFGLGEERVLSEVEIAVNALKVMTVLADARAEKVALSGPVAFLSHFLEIAKNATHPFEDIVLLDPDHSVQASAKTLSESAKRGGFIFVG